ncbi:glycosyltransferase family 4 protein [Cellulomonas xiejunii]|uniref:glycosyltransferase family 4 protein n=1 Tax=Cellulomonas xiejunii TaxID=2968083 RepID=UPI001D0ED269|nr:glycosyltransferase family 1 protein [Cellulomonas xiejunii]MCC2312921.1 glycosyltransferase family 4 protein [Cellulomonas xiejunii]
MKRTAAGALLTALDQRVAAAARAVGVDVEESSDPGATAATLLPLLVARARQAPRPDVAWLLLTAVRAAMPSSADVLALRRDLELLDDEDATARLLADVVRHPLRGALELELDVVQGVVVNADFCARHDIHTGIHRVVRETLPRWSGDFTVTANVDEYTALRTLAPREVERVLRYGQESQVDPAAERAYRARLVVPWRGVLLVPEIPDTAFGPALAALAEHSGNALVLIGYDMIPAVSADLRPPVDAVRFGAYLTVVKHAASVAAISASAAAEFAGFAHAVTAQGLPGPRVHEVVLPADVPVPVDPAQDGAAPGGRPRVLCVGSHEPHKNHDTVLHAAERLWRAGHEFELVLIGGPGWRSEEFSRRIEHVRSLGRPVTHLGRVTDDELWQAFRDARFSVFVSLHEGFGLPVAESLACGTPVVTSSYGSLAELARDGGCLTVDPTDDDAVTEAMHALLTSPDLLERLRGEARQRPRRTWDDYARDLWRTVTTAREEQM